MKKFKIHVAALLVSGALLVAPVQAHASCCAVLAGILTSVAGVLASIDATLKLALFDPLSIDPLSGGPTSVARILRQTQATDSINAHKEIKANQAALESTRNGLVAYEQEAQQLELWRRAMKEFPDPPADICGEYALASTSADARKSLQITQSKGSSSGLKRANKFESPGQVVADYKKVLKDKGVDYVLGGTITQPGCKPVYSKDKDGPTAFENKVPLPVSWDCTVAEAAPMTIPEDKVEAAQYVLNSVIDFEPVAQSQVGDRKTPAGQVYEAERSVHRAQMDIYRDFANDALSMYTANREVNKEGRDFLEGRGVKMPPVGKKISEMDYFSKQVEARWGSSQYMGQLDQMEEKNLLIAIQETQDLTNEILFKYVEMKNKQSMVDSMALSVEFNDKIKPVLQDARNKAVSP